MADKKKLVDKISKSNKTRFASALAVTALVGGGLTTIMLKGGENEALLYSGLDLTESAEIAGKLDQANIRYQIRGDGAAIFVNRAQVLDARMMLSEEGLPTRGAMGYEIFDKTDALGTTSFVQNINRVRALEGELARTITSLDMVRAARVHLVLPERRMFERDSQNPSASVVLSISGGQANPATVRAIRNLIAGSVPGLEVNRISVLDDKGRLLAAGAENGEDGLAGGNPDERKAGIEEHIRNTVLEIVEGVTGPGAARVQVSADVDFNRITQSSETFDPESRVLRSSTTTEEKSSESSRDGSGTVTAANNIPAGDAGGETADAGPENNSTSSRTEETANYEISKTTKTEIVEGGRIKRISVAVAVDDARQIDAEGQSSFSPRQQEELDRILTLVKSAVGYDAARGDIVEVVNVSFARPDISMEGGETKPGMFDMDKQDMMRLAELVVMLLGGVMLVLFVLRPLVRGLTSPPNEDKAPAPATPRLSAGAGQISLPEVDDGAGMAAALAGMDAALDKPGIDVARISGQVKASSIKKISEVVEQHPDESLQIIRTWLAQDVDRNDAA